MAGTQTASQLIDSINVVEKSFRRAIRRCDGVSSSPTTRTESPAGGTPLADANGVFRVPEETKRRTHCALTFAAVRCFCCRALSLVASAADALTPAGLLFEAHPDPHRSAQRLRAPRATDALNNAGVLVGVYNAPEARIRTGEPQYRFRGSRGRPPLSSLSRSRTPSASAAGSSESWTVTRCAGTRFTGSRTSARSAGRSFSSAAGIDDRRGVVDSAQISPGGQNSTPLPLDYDGGHRVRSVEM